MDFVGSGLQAQDSKTFQNRFKGRRGLFYRQQRKGFAGYEPQGSGGIKSTKPIEARSDAFESHSSISANWG